VCLKRRNDVCIGSISGMADTQLPIVVVPEHTEVVSTNILVDSTERSQNDRMTIRKNNMELIESKLNKVLYVIWYRKYIGYNFWNNIGSPMNLSITLLTALTTSSSTNTSIFSEQSILILQLTVLILSAMNTFFRPYVKANEHLKFMLEIQKFGAKFDEVYYRPKGFFKEEEYHQAAENYKTILFECTKYTSEHSVEHKNLFIDLLYILMVHTVLKKKEEEKEWVKLQYV
jgi:hypothetical protein